MDYLRLITRDSGVCRGQPVMKCTRVTLRTVLASLAEDASIQDILEDFPSLSDEHVRAAIAFAAASAVEDLPLSHLPKVSCRSGQTRTSLIVWQRNWNSVDTPSILSSKAPGRNPSSRALQQANEITQARASGEITAFLPRPGRSPSAACTPSSSPLLMVR
ncbi:MAG TPA: DUF433 domain-containing protein [Acidobacteriota bacterium]|nr:DUF433 domain-containing protein [Acidobacteriota bacterium]